MWGADKVKTIFFLLDMLKCPRKRCRTPSMEPLWMWRVSRHAGEHPTGLVAMATTEGSGLYDQSGFTQFTCSHIYTQQLCVRFVQAGTKGFAVKALPAPPCGGPSYSQVLKV